MLPVSAEGGRARDLIDEAIAALRAIEGDLIPLQSGTPSVSEWQRASASTGRSIAAFRSAMGAVNDELGLGGARSRLLTYFRSHVGEVLDGDELAGVAAIHEWARRVRELRVEHGWPIESGVQRPGLSPDQYVLVRDEPDESIAERWRTAKEIRNLSVSGKDRVLELLTRLSPEPADQDLLTYVAKIKSWARRVRELDEEGWEIRSNVDEPDLAPGTYRLATLERRPPRARQAIKLRYEILERDAFTCQDCRAERGTVRLQVHHVLMVSQGGTNDPSNLVTLCEDCHAGRHALAPGSTTDELRNPEGEPAA